MNKILKPHTRTMLAIARKFNCHVTKSKYNQSYCLLHNAIPYIENGCWFGNMISGIPSFLISDFDSHNWEIPVSANKKVIIRNIMQKK